MHIEGTQTIAAPIDRVWRLLMDPQQIGGCISGIQGIEVLDAEHFKVHVGLGLGAIKSNFTVDVAMIQLDPPKQATAKAHGAAPIGAVDATCIISLLEEGPDATRLQWSADLEASGTLAILGSRLMSSAAEKAAARFFTCITRKLEGQPTSSGS
jgi:carbon monoxide dehydrogenase subunit G